MILKNKKKIFRIRRKKIHWFNLPKSKEINESITISNLIWNCVQENFFLKKKFFFVIIQVSYYVQTNLSINDTMLNIYTTYMNKFINNRDVVKSVYLRTSNLVIISIPRTQLFFTLCKDKPFIIFTSGVIRVVMQLIDKCSKKKKVVIFNSIKFMWNLINSNYKDNFRIKFNKNFIYLKDVFSKIYRFNTKLDYILFEPKINFGKLNLNKRSALKKKLRKKKKIH